jgi:DNA-binding PadR family transcriptional regulator
LNGPTECFIPCCTGWSVEGWIESRWGESENGRKRKYYSLKKQGKKALEEQREQWVTVSTVFKQLWKERYV